MLTSNRSSQSLKEQQTRRGSQSKQFSLDKVHQPEKVRVLILSEQKILYQNFYFLKSFKFIIKLDLSYNRIVSFPKGFSFKQFAHLRTLLLHYNKFQKLNSLALLEECQGLVYLTLFGNPLQESLARHFCANLIKSLRVMDDKPILQDERYSGVLLESKSEFRSKSMGFPIIQNNEKVDSVDFISNVLREIALCRLAYKEANPILLIQQWWKRVRKQKNKYHQFLSSEQFVKAQIPSSKNRKPQQQKPIAQFEDHTKIPEKAQKLFLGVQNSNIEGKQVSQKYPVYVSLVANQRKPRQKSVVNSDQYKIFKSLLGFHEMIQGFKRLLVGGDELCSVFIKRSDLNQWKIEFKQNPTLNKKYIRVYGTPKQNKEYSIQKEQKKCGLSLIFYNNFSYLVELKSKARKNISDQQQLVLVDMSLQKKILLLKKAYRTVKLSPEPTSFPFLLAKPIVQISSALKIQKAWRGFKVRKVANILTVIKQRRAAVKIQRWVRNRRFWHRQSFLKDTFYEVQTNQSTLLILELNSFCSLRSPGSERQEKNATNLFSLPFSNSSINLLKGKKQREISQQTENSLSLSTKGHENIVQITSDRQPFPSYFNEYMDQCSLIEQPLSTDVILKQPNSQAVKVYDLVIKNAKSVKTLSSGPKDTKTFFAQLEYFSLKEANLRRALLKLLTYKFRTKMSLKTYSPLMDCQNIRNKYEQVGQNNFVKMIYDPDRDQSLSREIRQIDKHKSQRSQIQWLPTRVRYYDGPTNYSAFLITGLHKPKEQLSGSSSLTKLKNIGAKYKNAQWQQVGLTPSNAQRRQSLISRNVLSFRDETGSDMRPSPKLNLRYQDNSGGKSSNKIDQHLNQSSLNCDVNQDELSYKLTPKIEKDSSLNKSPLFQSIMTETPGRHQFLKKQRVMSVTDKKSMIEKQNQSHKERLQFIAEIRKRQVEEIHSRQKSLEQQHRKLIKENSESSLAQKLKKVRKIQHLSQHQEQVKGEQLSFEERFLRRGNFSMKQEMREFQKFKASNNFSFEQQKSTSEHIQNSGRVQNSRYVQSNLDAEAGQISEDFSRIRSGVKKMAERSKKNNLSLKSQILKTELKEFSMQLSEADFSALSEARENQDVLRQGIKLKKQSSNRIIGSEELEKEPMKHSQVEERQIKRAEGRKPQKHRVMFNSPSANSLASKLSSIHRNMQQKSDQVSSIEYDQGSILIRNEVAFEDLSLEDLKKTEGMKKKKVVHSVFPEEFYPIKDSQQIGFHLPRIKKSNKSSNGPTPKASFSHSNSKARQY